MRNGMLAFVSGAVLLLAACGGGSTGASSATGTQPPPAATSSPTDAGTGGQPSAEASGAAPTEAPPAGGGGTATGVCELVTADELAGIFGTAVTTEVIAGPPDNCIVQSVDGDALVAWSLTTAQAQLMYDAFTVDPSTVPVPGIGDKAAIVQNTGLMVLKGSSLLVITISGGSDMSEEEGIEASKQIGTIAAGRL